MTRQAFICMVFFSSMIFYLPLDCLAYDLESRYATITYSDHDALRRLNSELYMGRLRSKMKRSGNDTIEDEVVTKFNLIIEKVMEVLDMFPHQLRFTIVIHPGEAQVKEEFKRIYNVDVDYIAFYSPHKNTVFFSADNARLRVVAHEIGHVVAENYFTVSPPQRIHEVMAQFAEKHVTD